MARLRALRKANFPTNITELVKMGGHHLLANDGEDFLVFGARPTVAYMATTPLILADGTFSPVLPGYTQLYILHVVVAKNVSVPALFCLVKGKCKETYKTMLRLIEGIAEIDRKHFFNRPVTVMCDFEDGFINAVKDLYKSAKVKFCLFNLTQNIRKMPGRLWRKSRMLLVSCLASTSTPKGPSGDS